MHTYCTGHMVSDARGVESKQINTDDKAINTQQKSFLHAALVMHDDNIHAADSEYLSAVVMHRFVAGYDGHE